MCNSHELYKTKKEYSLIKAFIELKRRIRELFLVLTKDYTSIS
ncbi:hypothetical protein wVul_0511 [Wolbachia endosymbiont of Armadillidium vulgare str. wVulC]|nr:hypothetical protein wVul_0511 [Wolbachia endosymbiont of Armadillidium vulgare str. wVulC]